MKACEVTIFGSPYVLRSTLDEERIRGIAQLVDARMRTVAKSLPSASSTQVAVLAALDIASEPVAEEVMADCARLVDERVDAMLKLLDGTALES